MKNKCGLTLLELIVVMALMAIVLTVVVSMYSMGIKVFLEQGDSSYARQNVYSALYELVTDLKEASGINSASNVALSFWVDLNADAVRQSATEDISYAWSGNSGDPLTRTVNSQVKKVLPRVTYFNLAYDSAIVANIRLVSIEATALYNSQSFSFATSVKPRNIH